MITIYDRYERDFTTNGFGILEITQGVVEEELNGIFKFTGSYPLGERLSDKVTVGATLRIDTPLGQEPFRIWSINKTDGIIQIVAYHITFDLYYQIVEDKNLVELGGQSALTRLLEDTPFTAISDVTTTASARVVRKSVQQAIFGDDENSFLPRWGGEFLRTGFTLNAKNFRGRTFAQNPVAIRYGKNLVSYETEIDESTYYNRIMPVGFNGLLLPEKYVDRPGIDLSDIRTKIEEYKDIRAIEDVENPREDELPLAQAEQALRDAVNTDFAAGKFDPKVNHKIEFVELSNTIEYENKAVLEKRYLGDEVRILNEDLLDVTARVISYQYDPITKEYISMELGNFRDKPMNIISRVDLIAKTLDEVSVNQLTIEHVTQILTSALGGYVEEYNGELFAMDNPDPMVAQKIARWNYEGLGFSSTGINGPYDTAILRDGTIVGKFISVGSISANQLKSDVGQQLNLSSNLAITGLVSDISSLDGRLDSAELKITPEAITQTVESNTTTLAKKAELTVVDDAIRAELSRKTGRNLLLASGVRAENSNYIIAQYALSEPIAAGETVTLTIWGELAPSRTMFNAYNSGDTVALGTPTLKSPGVYQVTFPWVAGSNTSVWIFQFPSSDTASSIIRRIQLERGELGTEWNQATEELITGISEITETGVKVGRNDTDMQSTMEYDGFRVIRKSDGVAMAEFTKDIGKMDRLEAQNVSAPNIVKKLTESLTVYIGPNSTGDGSGDATWNLASSIKHALAMHLDEELYIPSGVVLTINLALKINETFEMSGFFGPGKIVFSGWGNGDTQITGRIKLNDVSCVAELNGIAFASPGTSEPLLEAFHSPDVRVNDCWFDGANAADAVYSQYGSYIRLSNCRFANVVNAFSAWNAQISAYNCTGNNVQYPAQAVELGRVLMFGQRPTAINASRTFDGGVVTDIGTPTSTAWGLTPAAWTTVTKTFRASLYTANNVGYVWLQNAYRQGSWDGKAQYGTANFGSQISDFLQGSGGFQNLGAVTMSVRRNTTSGRSSDVSFKAISPTVTSPGMTFGETEVFTAPAELVNAMQTGSLLLKSTTTAESDYAGFDLVEITITCQKKV